MKKQKIIQEINTLLEQCSIHTLKAILFALKEMVGDTFE